MVATHLPSLATLPIGVNPCKHHRANEAHADDQPSLLTRMSLDAMECTVLQAAMQARTADNPAKEIGTYMLRFCEAYAQKTEEGDIVGCPDDWYRLALATFGYEWTGPKCNVMFPDRNASNAYMDSDDVRVSAPQLPALPYRGVGSWKELFDGTCSLLINGLDQETQDAATSSWGAGPVTSGPIFTVQTLQKPEFRSRLARQLSNPHVPQRTLDMLLHQLLSVIFFVVPLQYTEEWDEKPLSESDELESWQQWGTGRISTANSRLRATVTFLLMRGANAFTADHYSTLDYRLESALSGPQWPEQNGVVENVMKLLEAGADPNLIADEEGEFAAGDWLLTHVIAYTMGHGTQVPNILKIVQLLLDNGAAVPLDPYHSSMFFSNLLIMTFETQNLWTTPLLTERLIDMLPPSSSFLVDLKGLRDQINFYRDQALLTNTLPPVWLMPLWEKFLSGTAP